MKLCLNLLQKNQLQFSFSHFLRIQLNVFTLIKNYTCPYNSIHPGQIEGVHPSNFSPPILFQLQKVTKRRQVVEENYCSASWLRPLFVTGFWKISSNVTFYNSNIYIQNEKWDLPIDLIVVIVPTLNYQKIIGNTLKSSIILLLWSQ